MKAFKLFLILSMIAVASEAQTDHLSDGFNLYQAKKYPEAKAEFLKFRETNKTDPTGLYFIASADVHLKAYDKAVDRLDSMLLMHNIPKHYTYQARYQLAICYAATAQKEQALRELQFLADNNVRYARNLTDPVFDDIRGDERFVRAMEKMAESETPCLFDSQYKKLNFFLGAWDVYVGNKFEQKVAADTVTAGPGGCSVNENFKWRGGNYAGRSMIFFDPGAQKYRMCWAGMNGDIRNFEEISEEPNKMVLLAITNSDDNELVHRRMTLTFNPDEGSVHQFIENSTDFGKTWSVAFDAMFRKAK